MGLAWQVTQPKPRPGQQRLTVLANNRGEDNRQSFTGFVREQNPDLLVLQEDGRADAFRAAYPGFFAESQARYTLVSRFPIKSSGLLELPSAMPEVVAAWFEIEYAGRSVMVYNIHLPTPRAELRELRGRGLLLALLPFTPGRLAAKRALVQAPWDRRLKIVQELEQTLARETRPYILAGDFNAPSWGLVHRRIAGHAIDTFAEAGRGFGFTFPGETRNPLTAFGPWLRIDYVFGSQHFRPLSALAEPRRTSQHRCTVATLELADSKNP
jgi:endonuclease/exonuclease/phosphatase (EEP) superfamily protein YafD